jgi:TfoX/Sxy family transcriptional regulator of competence genes
MAFDATLASRLQKMFEGDLDIREIKMFGGLCFTCRGHMFVGIVGDKLMARIGKDQYPKALQQKNVREVNFNGKPMAGYVFVDAEGIVSAAALLKWVNLSLHFIDSLPPK